MASEVSKLNLSKKARLDLLKLSSYENLKLPILCVLNRSISKYLNFECATKIATVQTAHFKTPQIRIYVIKFHLS